MKKLDLNNMAEMMSAVKCARRQKSIGPIVRILDEYESTEDTTRPPPLNGAP